MTCNGAIDVDGELVRVNIQDTSEKGMRLASIDYHLRWAEAVMLIYSSTDPSGFRQLKDTAIRIVDKLSEMDDKELSRVPPITLVANKCDLDFPRKVSRQEGFELAERLHCDFYETSAREGWSKLITKIGGNSSQGSSEILTSLASSTSAVGMGLVPNFSHVNSTDQSAFKGRARSNSSFGVSGEVSLHLPKVSIISAPKSDSGTPSQSEEENEDSKSRLALPKGRKSRSGIIRKLSPRLGRKFGSFRETKNDKKMTLKLTGSKNVNNNNISLVSGLSTAFLVAGSPVCQDLSSPTSSEGNDSSRTTSATGSMESLTSAGLEGDLSTLTLRSSKTEASQQKNFVFREHDFCVSEPFLQLCRDGRSQRSRMRARSPSNLFRSGIKRIRLLTTDAPNALRAQQN